jgi:hypothetical protein
MSNLSEFETPSDNPIPEKCRDCFLATMMVGISSGFVSSTGGPDQIIKNIEEFCPGYDIEPVDAETPQPQRVDSTSGEFIAFPVPTQSQLSRCALKSL